MVLSLLEAMLGGRTARAEKRWDGKRQELKGVARTTGSLFLTPEMKWNPNQFEVHSMGTVAVRRPTSRNEMVEADGYCV